ncbi:uncharacterized protein LOC142168154 [Nicotiana tabacum]|uniref:Uncharacterized protein LOC142168154 n=1 Tax=Nicotiana tabacum TaxID=4097 RepID=A0AC58SIV7_TOBAC
MGHIPFAKLKCIPSVSSDLSTKQSFICSICPLARQARLPFPDSRSSSTSLFQLIHIDTWGPYHTQTYSGAKYFLTIVDDFSRATWTHLMSSKSNAFTLLKVFIATVKTQFNLSVQTMRSDNSLELEMSSSISLFFPSISIILFLPLLPLSFPPGFPPYFDDSTSNFPSVPPPSPSPSILPPSVTSSPTSISPAPAPAPVSPLPAVRKSARSHHLPSHLQNYVVQLLPSISCSSTTSTSAAQYAAVEPHSYAQAVANPVWQEAMRKEFEALEANGTWDIVELAKGKKPIGCKWAYKIKYKADGSVKRYKARLVVRGDTQIEGIDFHEIFSPVFKMCTIRCLIAYTVKQKWSFFQLDINNAFLHGDLDEEVCMKLPQGLSVASESHVHTLKSPQSTVFIAVYVDDIILTWDDMLEIVDLKSFLDDQFRIKDLGLLHYFLGIQIHYHSSGVLLHQQKFITDLLAGFDCSTVSSVICPWI